MKSIALFLTVAVVCALTGFVIVGLIGPALGVSLVFGGEEHDGYLELARHLVAGEGYVFTPGGPPVFHRPPGYPLLLAPFMVLPESWHHPVVILINAALLGVMAVTTRQLARALDLPPTAAMWAVPVLLANPWLMWSVKNPMSVILQATLYLLLVTHLVEFMRSPTAGRGRIAVVAASAAMLVLTHGTMLPLILVGIGGAVAAGLALRRPLWTGAGVAVLAAVALAVVPWAVRNYTVTGLLIPVAGNAGVAYFGGNAHWQLDPPSPPPAAGSTIQEELLAYAGIDRPVAEVMHYWGLKSPEDEVAINRTFARHALDHPLMVLGKSVLNAIEFYAPLVHCTTVPDASCTVEKIGRSIYYTGLWVMALLGVLLGPGRAAGVALGAIALWILPYLPFLSFIGHSMYNFGTLPFLAILAAIPIARALPLPARLLSPAPPASPSRPAFHL